MKLSIDIRIKAPKDANQFLRCLWARFRKDFGKCAWQYSPYRDGPNSIIFIGYMDLNLENNQALSCSVAYKEKGSIEALIFEDVRNSKDEGRIRQCVLAARDNYQNLSTFSFQFSIKSLHGSIASYRGSNLLISSRPNSGVNQITLSLLGYDSVDAESVARGIRGKFLGILSVFTNTLFLSPVRKSKSNRPSLPKTNIFFEDEGWIDDYPELNGKLAISRACLHLLELLVADALSPELEKFANACLQFHSGRKLDAQINDQLVITKIHETSDGGTIEFKKRDARLTQAAAFEVLSTEIVNVLYVSALETVTTTLDFEKQVCKECNQPIYSISKRVEALAEKYLGESGKKAIKQFYTKRSKFVHTGSLSSRYDYGGTSIPQLDSENPLGCKTQITNSDKNLREITSFIIRKQIEEVLLRDRS